MDKYDWNNVTEEQVNPLMTRQTLQLPSLKILRLRFQKGAVVPTHNHKDEQVTLVTSGSIRFTSNGTESVLGAGGVLRIPSDLPHSLEALEDSTSTELFMPVPDGQH